VFPADKGFVGAATYQVRSFAVVSVVILAGAVVLLMTSRRSDLDGNRSTSKSKIEAPASMRGVDGVRVGESNSQLYLPGRGFIEVAVDQNAASELIAAVSNKNQEALDSLVESGRVLRINNRTRVQVIENNAGQARVRILEGEYIMREGWVPERWIK
jgi:hypothetical protein